VNLTVLVLMLILVHAALMAVLLTFPKSAGAAYWFYLPSLLIAWAGYLAYEGIYIPRYCPGDCAIRVDLLFILPWLVYVTACAVAYFARKTPPGNG
jgi:hypothetical protein